MHLVEQELVLPRFKDPLVWLLLFLNLKPPRETPRLLQAKPRQVVVVMLEPVTPPQLEHDQTTKKTMTQPHSPSHVHSHEEVRARQL